MLHKVNKEIQIQGLLLKWYLKNKRTLPWRKLQKNKLPNPYYIFVSEFMLQQTTVGAVKKRFTEFIKKWPTIDALASISEKTILSFWSGLGYYSRAVNLLKAARLIKKNFNSKVPNTFDELLILPGIGDYTAKAILGIAYNQPVMPLDANIERIFARIYGFELPLIKIKKELFKKSSSFISEKNSTRLIQAFMDYGSIVCKPRNPDCSNCLIKSKCISYKRNLQNTIPVKIKIFSKKRIKFSRAYILFNEKNEILVRKRPSKGMLASMLEVPNDNWVTKKKKLIQDKIIDKIKDKIQFLKSIKYSFSHFDLKIEVFSVKVKKTNFPKNKWIKKNNLKNSSLPTVMKKIISAAI